MIPTCSPFPHSLTGSSQSIPRLVLPVASSRSVFPMKNSSPGCSRVRSHLNQSISFFYFWDFLGTCCSRVVGFDFPLSGRTPAQCSTADRSGAETRLFSFLFPSAGVPLFGLCGLTANFPPSRAATAPSVRLLLWKSSNGSHLATMNRYARPCFLSRCFFPQRFRF